MRRAKDLMGAGEYAQAAESLVEPMAEARQSAAGLPMPILADAGFLYAEARYRALPVDPGLQASESVINLIDKAVEGSATHPRAPYALTLERPTSREAGDAFRRGCGPMTGSSTTTAMRPTATKCSLMPRASHSHERNPNRPSCTRAQIMQHDPTSPKGMEAELLIADAYALSGMLDEARSIYVEMAEDVANTAEGSQAFQRLGEIALGSRPLFGGGRPLRATSGNGNDHYGK